MLYAIQFGENVSSMAKESRLSLNMSAKDYKDQWLNKYAMLYHKTVYDHDDWTMHRNGTRHGRHLLRIVGFSLWPPVIILTCYAAAIAGYNAGISHRKKYGHLGSHLLLLHVSPQPLPFAAAALAILLGFRTNICYTRFDEARKAWGMNLNRSRDLTRQVLTWMRSSADTYLLHCFLHYLMAFSYCMKDHLTNDNTLKEDLSGLLEGHDLEQVLVSTHRPNFVLQVLSELLGNSHVSEMMQGFISQNITQLQDDLGTCERLFKTPIPLSYTHLTSQVLIVWHIVLPVALWDQCGWIVVPASFLSAAALICIDEVGVQIENPFLILPLNAICDGIRTNIESLISVHDKLASLHHVTMKTPTQTHGDYNIDIDLASK